MPARDGTGPVGYGPRTGRGLGPCGAGFNRGFGRGFCRGLGMGMRRFAPSYPVEFTKDEQKKILEAEKADIETELKEIEARLKELKKE